MSHGDAIFWNELFGRSGPRTEKNNGTIVLLRIFWFRNMSLFSKYEISYLTLFTWLNWISHFLSMLSNVKITLTIDSSSKRPIIRSKNVLHDSLKNVCIQWPFPDLDLDLLLVCDLYLLIHFLRYTYDNTLPEFEPGINWKHRSYVPKCENVWFWPLTWPCTVTSPEVLFNPRQCRRMPSLVLR